MDSFKIRITYFVGTLFFVMFIKNLYFFRYLEVLPQQQQLLEERRGCGPPAITGLSVHESARGLRVAHAH